MWHVSFTKIEENGTITSGSTYTCFPEQEARDWAGLGYLVVVEEH